MIIVRDIDKSCNIKKPVVALGNFDGIHIGHQALIKKTVDLAKTNNATAVLFTFYPHPLKVIKQSSEPFIIQTFKEKVKVAQKLGIEAVVCARFTKEFSNMHPEMFVKEILIKRLGAVSVCVGHDYTFGERGRGNIKALREFSNDYDFELVVIPPIKINGIIVSSSKIREFLQAGDIENAKMFLGRPYTISGIVKKGDGRGRRLGFPTANVYPKNDILLKDGVYAAYVFIDSKKHIAAVNVGYNPTFKGEEKHIESFLLDFESDIYGKRIDIEFVKFIRGERRFKKMPDLINQIQEDVAKIKHIL